MSKTNRRRFLGKSLGMVSTAVVSRPVAAAVPPAAARGQIKIRDVETIPLRFPPGHPFADAIHIFGPERGGLIVKIHTDAGITGWGYSSFGMIRGGPNVVGTIVNAEMRPALIGQDPFFNKKLRADLWKATEYHGVQGVAQFAMAAVDIALWDICGKALDVLFRFTECSALSTRLSPRMRWWAGITIPKTNTNMRSRRPSRKASKP